MGSEKAKPCHADMMIKVCGMREQENILAVASLTPMLMGFIFHKESPRDASSLNPDAVKSLPPFIRPVGVFVDKPDEYIISVCTDYSIKIVQLHGSESPEQCLRLKRRGYTVFKAFGIVNNNDFDNVSSYEEAVDMFLFDTQSASHGGSGKKFDWSSLESYNLDTPYLLSGGIGPDDVDAIVKAVRPGMAGIDINSRFETSPGIKDINKLINFILSLRKFNEHEPNTTPFWEKKI